MRDWSENELWVLDWTQARFGESDKLQHPGLGEGDANNRLQGASFLQPHKADKNVRYREA